MLQPEISTIFLFLDSICQECESTMKADAYIRFYSKQRRKVVEVGRTRRLLPVSFRDRRGAVRVPLLLGGDCTRLGKTYMSCQSNSFTQNMSCRCSPKEAVALLEGREVATGRVVRVLTDD